MKSSFTLAMVAALAAHACASAQTMGCLVEPDRVADLGSQSTGVIDRLLVERGDMVQSGQVLARLGSRVERASLSVAEARSQADAEYRQAVAASELARKKLERSRDLLKQSFISDQAVEQAEAEARVAEQRVAQARESQKVAQKEFQLSSAQLGQREVRSPFDGIVIERYRTEGERIEREPVFRVARIDPLRVEAIVPAAQFGQISPGQTATIRTDLPQFPMLQAQVTLVDRVIDPASNSFRVRLTLPNPEHRIPSGLRCRVEFAGTTARSPLPVPPAMAPARAPLPAPAPAPAPATAPARAPLPAALPAKPMPRSSVKAVPPEDIQPVLAMSLQLRPTSNVVVAMRPTLLSMR